jgi:predicted nucleotidyltransferase
VETIELNKAAILDMLHRHREQILAFGVCKIGLFGSFVRNAQDADSDIDILVHFRKDSKKLKNLIGLAECLESWFHTKVDLVTAESLSPVTGYHILNEVEYAAIAC